MSSRYLAKMNTVKSNDFDTKSYKLLGIWQSKYLRWLNYPKAYLMCHCLLAVVTASMAAGVTIVNIPKLEKRFDFSPADSSFIMAGNNIAFCTFILFVAYFGERYNKARFTAIGGAIFGLGALMYALPHFTTEIYELPDHRFQLSCKPQQPFDCEIKQELQYTKYLLFIGMFLMGCGLTPFYSLGFTHMEQSISPRSTSMYFGNVYAYISIGATVGIIGGGTINKEIYVDFDSNATELQLGNYDWRWIGAWWLFPLVAMGASWIVVAILAGYPKYLKGTAKYFHQRSSQIYGYGSHLKTNRNFSWNISGFLKAILHLISNPAFIFLTFAGCIQNLLLTGLGDNVMKYYEGSLNMRTEDAGLTFGFLFSLGTILGSFIGGLVVYVFNWKIPGIFKFCVFSFGAAAAFSPGFLLYCENIPVAGVTYSYGNRDDFTKPSVVNVTSSCNEHCFCQEDSYIPVCGSDNITYFSPCHAGCPVVIAPYTYGRCGCVEDNTPVSIGFTQYKAAVDSCPIQCPFKTYTLLLTLGLVFSIGMVFAPMLVVTYRLIPNSLKSLAVALQFVLYRCLGTIPASELFQEMLSPACLLWQTHRCTRAKGRCSIYSNKEMSTILMLIGLYGNVIAILFLLLAAYFYKPSSLSDGRTQEAAWNDKPSDESASFVTETTENDETFVTKF